MRSLGASTAALRCCLESLPAAAAAIGTFDVSGRTDTWIIREAARRGGVDEPAATACYREGYVPLLEEELAARDLAPLPGAAETLAALEDSDEVTSVLGTGNGRAGAFAKVAAVGLDHHFSGGGFGDRHDDRVMILREAVEEAGWREGDRLVVIGDTEHDVAAALSIGAVAVGVATGGRSEPHLAAAGANVTLPDLGDVERSLAALLG
jgi:phosphoglycolate phosphatase-like HAD superfamily hydrolase